MATDSGSVLHLVAVLISKPEFVLAYLTVSYPKLAKKLLKQLKPAVALTKEEAIALNGTLDVLVAQYESASKGFVFLPAVRIFGASLIKCRQQSYGCGGELL
jgi:hypothetical protein